MEYNKLPGTEIEVSKICLGTMTWGTQNTKEEAFEQMDYALANGVNFFDTAELYPVPASADTYATTEVYIGEWLESRKSRDKIILASKIAGPGDYTAHIRKTGFKGDSIDKALDESLKRLKTDYIDLYQLHWPERLTNYFAVRNFKYFNDSWEDNFQEILHKLKKAVDAGKVRHVGLSNENPWGIMKFLEYSKNELPKMITIQNPYSLLNRLFEIGSGEICKRENVGLLAYSPLGFGVLTGKYRNGNVPKNSRLDLFPTMARYTNDNCKNATELYHQIAEKHNLTLTELALAFVNDRPFVTSNIIGATNMQQLKENIDSIEINLTQDILEEIENIHLSDPNPCT